MSAKSSGPDVPRRSVLQAGLMLGASTLALPASGETTAGTTSLEDTQPGSSVKLTVERRGHVVLLGINRPDAENRIDPETYAQLAQAYYRYDRDPDLRAAVLFGHGDHFSRGIDVAAFEPLIVSGNDLPANPAAIDPFGKTKPRLSKPVVVVAHGDALNIGHELCLSADIRVASANARFAQTENTQARMPGSGATVRFVRDAGWGQAMRYLLTGKSWDAEEAKKMGLFQEIAPTPEAALALGIEIATQIAACAPLSIRTTLASAHLVIDEDEERALSALIAQRRSLYGTQDFKEGVRAKAENRPPLYQGK